MKKSLALFLLLIFIAVGQAAVGAWSMDSKIVNLSYSGTALNSSQTLTIRRTGTSGKVNFYLLITSASIGSGDPGSRRVYLNGTSEYESSLQVYIRRSTGTTEISSLNETGAYALIGSIANGSSSTTVSIKVATSSGKMPQGSYTNTFSVQIFTGTQTPPDGVPDAIGTLTVNVNATQANTMTMSFSDNGICDFGAMEAGNSYSKTISMTVTAPATFTISAASKNGGKLLLAPDEVINYSFYFDGTLKDLSGGIVKLVTSTTTATNRVYTLDFVTETLAFAEAGQYTDSLYLMFTTS
jgi:hypothetical protein